MTHRIKLDFLVYFVSLLFQLFQESAWAAPHFEASHQNDPSHQAPGWPKLPVELKIRILADLDLSDQCRFSEICRDANAIYKSQEMARERLHRYNAGKLDSLETAAKEGRVDILLSALLIAPDYPLYFKTQILRDSKLMEATTLYGVRAFLIGNQADLLYAGNYPAVTFDHQRPPLHYLCETPMNPDEARKWVDRFSKSQRIEKFNNLTPLFIAFKSKNKEMVDALLDTFDAEEVRKSIFGNDSYKVGKLFHLCSTDPELAGLELKVLDHVDPEIIAHCPCETFRWSEHTALEHAIRHRKHVLFNAILNKFEGSDILLRIFYGRGSILSKSDLEYALMSPELFQSLVRAGLDPQQIALNRFALVFNSEQLDIGQLTTLIDWLPRERWSEAVEGTSTPLIHTAALSLNADPSAFEHIISRLEPEQLISTDQLGDTPLKSLLKALLRYNSKDYENVNQSSNAYKYISNYIGKSEILISRMSNSQLLEQNNGESHLQLAKRLKTQKIAQMIMEKEKKSDTRNWVLDYLWPKFACES